jgi:phosphatidylinositol dimannoside acyltransferase
VSSVAAPTHPEAPRQAPPQNPPHAPEAGWVRRVLGPFYVTGVFWFRLHHFGVARVPQRLIGLAIALFAGLFFVTLRNIRSAIAANLEAVLGPCGWLERQRRIWRTLWTFSWSLTERYELLATERPFRVEPDGLATWREAIAAGRGVVLVTAHLGNWEAGSMAPASSEGVSVHVVRESETDPRAQEFLAELIRKRSGERYRTHFAEDPRLGLDLLDALRSGEVVALQGDRPRADGRACERTIEVPLFGRPFPLPVGPVALARAAGAPLVPVFVFREGRRQYRCVFRDPIHVSAEDGRRPAIEAALARFAADLEWAIRRTPHQWYCFRRVWESDPQIESSRPPQPLQ